MLSRRTIVAAALACALVSGACDGGGDGDGALPSRDATSTSGPPPARDPAFAVPATIDEAYVNRVLAELDRVQGDVVRAIVERGAFDQSDVLPLRAVFLDPELRAQTEGFAGLVGRIDQVRRPPGDNRTTVVRLVTARPDCIYAETLVDVAATVVDPPEPFTTYIALRPSRPGSDPERHNPTPYSIAAEHTEPADPCG